MYKTSVSLLFTTLVASSAFGQCFTVTSTSAGGNTQNGAMFDVVNISAAGISIGSFDQAFQVAGTSHVFVYTKVGTWNGFESSPGAWTLVGSDPAVVHGAFPAIDPVPIPVGVAIGPGATQAFYITCDPTIPTNTPRVTYTTGLGQLGAVIGSNIDLEVRCGVGIAFPFGTTAGLPTAGRLWIGSINYCPIVPGTVLATNTSLGVGCGTPLYTSFYEFFADPPTGLDLSNTSFTMTPVGGGYSVTAGGSFLPVGSVSAPVVIAVGDDVQQTITLAAMGPFPAPTGPATTLDVCSNGYVSTGDNGINWTPVASEFLNSPETSWRCWHDFSNNLTGSGQVKFEESATVSVITWDSVREFLGTGPLDDSTWQIQFYPSGTVVFAFGTMSTSGAAGSGSAYLIGYSPGGSSLDPGSADLSAALTPGPIVLKDADTGPLALAAASRPITNTNWILEVSSIPPTGLFGVSIFGIADPGIPDLFFLGMPGCPLRTTLDLLDGPWLVTGPTQNYGFAIPNDPSLVNFHLFTQAAVWTVPAQNAFGAITSGGVDGKVGDY